MIDLSLLNCECLLFYLFTLEGLFVRFPGHSLPFQFHYYPVSINHHGFLLRKTCFEQSNGQYTIIKRQELFQEYVETVYMQYLCQWQSWMYDWCLCLRVFFYLKVSMLNKRNDFVNILRKRTLNSCNFSTTALNELKIHEIFKNCKYIILKFYKVQQVALNVTHSVFYAQLSK